MAGEVENAISLQAECLPTGSISFGRFDSESLSWEKRSSFSHNRYLEEVEKFSTPGSVTQKKAYFEEHFKKRGLFRQVSSVSSSGSDGRTTECGSYYDDRSMSVDGYGNHYKYEESWNRGSSDIGHEDQVVEHENVEFPNRGECSIGHDNPCIEVERYDELVADDGEVQLCRQDDQLLVVEEAASVISNERGRVISSRLSCEEMHDEVLASSIKTYSEGDQAIYEYNSSPKIVDSRILVRHETTDILDEEHIEKANAPHVDPRVENYTSSREAKTNIPVKGKPAMDRRAINQKSQPSNARRLQRLPIEKKSMKAPSTPEMNGSQWRKPVLSPAKHYISRSDISKDSKSVVAKQILLTKSGNDSKLTKKAGNFQSSYMKRAPPVTAYINRPKQAVSSGKPGLMASHSFISSIHSERVEMRKKEAREKVDLVKSMDFKARPLPSFYRQDTPRASIDKKTLARSTKLADASLGNKAIAPNKPEAATRLDNPKAQANVLGRHAVSSSKGIRHDKIDAVRGTSVVVDKEVEKRRPKFNHQPVDSNRKKDANASNVRASATKK